MVVPPTKDLQSGDSQPAASSDPNEKLSPTGYGVHQLIGSETLLPYRVNFENEEDATAPAQIVTIADQLDTDLNWATFELTEIGFGDERIPVPADTQYFETSVATTYNNVDFDVQIVAGIDLSTGKVFAYFYSIDPSTGLPPAVDYGFLPPEDGTGRGQGYLSYTIRPEKELTSGTEIRNVAEITFDYQETIATNQVDPHDPSQGTDPNKECLNTIAPDQANLVTASTDGGSVAAPGEGTSTYAWGETINITATTDEGNVFVEWAGDVNTIADVYAAETTVTMYDNFSITATFMAGPPVADAGKDINIRTGMPCVLDGSESFDPDNELITFNWSFINVPGESTVTDLSLTGITGAKPNFSPDVDGTYSIELTVTDGILSDTDYVSVFSFSDAVPPNANAGPEQFSLTGSLVNLDGSKSNDPDTDMGLLYFEWTFNQLPEGSLVTDDSIFNRYDPNAWFTPDVGGLYLLSLFADDGTLDSQDEVQIISSSQIVPPNARAGNDQSTYLGD